MAEHAVRALIPGDLEAVIALDRTGNGAPRRGFFERRFAAMDRHPDGFLGLGCDEADRLVGFALGQVLEGEFGARAPAGVLDALGVDPARRRHGIGSALLRVMAGALAARGARELRTQVAWGQPGLVAFFAEAGFAPAPRLVLERRTEDPDLPAAADEAGVDETPLARDRIPVRSLQAADLEAIARIDRAITGADRRGYLERKLREVLHESGVRVSLVAEADERVAGFAMARVDYGEFGRAETTAVLDTIDVDPERTGAGIARALLSQLLKNLQALHVETLRTEVAWDDLALLGFLRGCGFAPAARIALGRALP